MTRDNSAGKPQTFRMAVQEYAAKKHGKPFGQLSNTETGRATLEFFLKGIMQRLEPGRLPEDEDELLEGITDGKDDVAVDYIHRSDDGQVTLIQSKYLGKRKPLDRKDVVDFCDTLSRLYRHHDYQMNARVREVAQDINWREDEFTLIIVALGNVDPNCEAAVTEGVRPVREMPDLSSRVSLELLDEAELTQRLREAEVASRGISSTIELPFHQAEGQSAWLVEEGPLGARSYVGIVEARQLIHLWKRHKSSLFNVNIRGYVGGTSTNEGIMDTARNRPDRFLFYNNGIAAVCTSTREMPNGHALSCDHFAILNGAQTVRSLVRAIQKRGVDAQMAASIGRCRVVIRVTEVDYLRSQDKAAFLDDMCRFNNTQNAVRVADFRSNDRTQISLHQHFDKLSLRGKRYHYKNKREEQKPNRIGISLDAFAKTVHAFEFGPVDMFGGSNALYALGADGRYEVLFGPKDEPLSEDRFREMAGAWFTCAVVKQRVKEIVLSAVEPDETEGVEAKMQFTANIKSIEGRLVFHAVALIMKRAAASARVPWEREIQSLARPEATEANSVAWTRIRDQTDAAAYILKGMYVSALKEADFAHRNWFRKPATLTALRQNVAGLPGRMIAPSVRAE